MFESSRQKAMKKYPNNAEVFLCGHRGKKISYLFPKRAPNSQNKSDSPQAMTNFMMP
jgi:hypothetical protein